jgi:hypothetical protein
MLERLHLIELYIACIVLAGCESFSVSQPARSANHALRARTVLYEHARIQAARRIVTPEQSSLGRSLLMSGRCCRAWSVFVRFENVRPHTLH